MVRTPASLSPASDEKTKLYLAYATAGSLCCSRQIFVGMFTCSTRNTGTTLLGILQIRLTSIWVKDGGWRRDNLGFYDDLYGLWLDLRRFYADYACRAGHKENTGDESTKKDFGSVGHPVLLS